MQVSKKKIGILIFATKRGLRVAALPGLALGLLSQTSSQSQASSCGSRTSSSRPRFEHGNENSHRKGKGQSLTVLPLPHSVMHTARSVGVAWSPGLSRVITGVLASKVLQSEIAAEPIVLALR